MKIVVGSTSEHKLAAVRSACIKLGIDAEVSGIKTSSGVNEQPVGLKETFDGALARASSAKESILQKDIYVGIENGIVDISRSSTVDLAVVVILTSDDRRIVATSAGIEFPQDCVNAFNKTTTVGSVIAEKTGCDPTDPHSYLTRGKVSRKAMLVQALMIALSQL